MVYFCNCENNHRLAHNIIFDWVSILAPPLPLSLFNSMNDKGITSLHLYTKMITVTCTGTITSICNNFFVTLHRTNVSLGETGAASCINTLKLCAADAKPTQSKIAP